jgi:hypothetical protein
MAAPAGHARKRRAESMQENALPVQIATARKATGTADLFLTT